MEQPYPVEMPVPGTFPKTPPHAKEDALTEASQHDVPQEPEDEQVSAAQYDEPDMQHDPALGAVDPELGEAWSWGEVRKVLRKAKAILDYRGIDGSTLLSNPKWQRAYPLFAADLTSQELEDELDFGTSGEVTRLARNITARLVAVLPPGTLNIKELREEHDYLQVAGLGPVLTPEEKAIAKHNDLLLEKGEWRHGEPRKIVQCIGSVIVAHDTTFGTDMAKRVLRRRPNYRIVYDLLLDHSLGVQNIADQLGYAHRSHLSRVTKRILGMLVREVRPQILNLEAVMKTVRGERPPPRKRPPTPATSVGGRLSTLLGAKHPDDKSRAIEELARSCDRHITTVWRFLRGASYPSEKKIEPLLTAMAKHLQLSPDEVASLKADYRAELEAERSNRKSAR